MKKTVLAFVFASIFPFIILAQKTSRAFTPVTSLHFNFLGLADPLDENFSVGAEQRFHSNWSAGADAAYIFHSAYFRQAKGASGFIARPFIRTYPNADRKLYIELQLHYKYVLYKMEDWIGRDVVNGVPAYEEFTKFNYKKQATGAHINFGSSMNISRDDKFQLDFYMGVGVRTISQRAEDGEYQVDNTAFSIVRRQNHYTGPVLPMGVRLVYVLQ